VAFFRVRKRVRERGIHHAHGTSGRLETTDREPAHLQVEPAIEALVPADERRERQEEIFEDELEAVHAPVANRRDGSATQDAAARLDELERVTGEGGLLRHEEAEAAMAVFTGAAEEHQELRPASERAPEFRAVDAPTVADPVGAALH
jgi:hypothetical protein